MIYLTNLVALARFLCAEEGNFSVDPQFFSALEPFGTLKSLKSPEILSGN
jgi:hypothetical protein